MPSIIDNNVQAVLLVDEMEDAGNGKQASLVKRNKNLKTEFLDINPKVETLFQAYANEDFDDGMESEFISEIVSLVQKYGAQAVEAIKPIIITQNVKPYVAFEVLRWLGRINHLESHRSRLLFLEMCLDNPSRLVRDGAALGLASMKDAHAIPYLREALAQEKIQDLRKDMETVLWRIENSNAAISLDDK